MLTEPFFANPDSLATGACLMHKQASFLISSLSGFDTNDFSTFEFPAVDPAFDDAAVGAGVYVAALNDSKEARQVTRFMVNQQFGRAALAESDTGWILPNVRFDTSRYSNEFTRSFTETVHAALLADQFRFDASDLMPAQVGACSFWPGIVDLVAGAKTIPPSHPRHRPVLTRANQDRSAAMESCTDPRHGGIPA